ncbi:hypothetical protein CL634_07490 [bacterium]|nr:hypothetical protein [bacterium]
MFDVISIGSATVDIFVQSDQFIVKKDKTFPSGSSLSVDFSSKPEISQFLISSGGGATNSSVAFSRLGLKSIPLSLIGSDLLQNYIISDLKKAKIPTTFLASSPREKTDFAVILVAPNGSRTILVNRGASRLEEKHIPFSKIKKTRWFYITSLEGNLNLLEKLIGFAREHHIKVSLNPGSREISQADKLFPLLKFVDFLLLNRQEAEILTSQSFSQKTFFKKIQSLGPLYTAVTCGRQGAHLLSQHDNYFSPIVKSKTTDETGAGDSFGSTFVAGLIYQLPPDQALFWAMKNSASVVSHFGAKTGLLTLSRIKK